MEVSKPLLETQESVVDTGLLLSLDTLYLFPFFSKFVVMELDIKHCSIALMEYVLILLQGQSMSLSLKETEFERLFSWCGAKKDTSSLIDPQRT